MDKQIEKTKEFVTANFERKGYIRLDLNENSGVLNQTILSKLKKIDPFTIGAYPDYAPVHKLLAKREKVSPKNICIFNGADAGIVALLRLFFKPKDEVIMPIPTFGLYHVALSLIGVKPKAIPYTRDKKNDGFLFPTDKVLAAISSKTKGVLLCSPNNPLGVPLDKETAVSILKKCKKYDIPVIVDEAYYEFHGRSLITYFHSYSNLILIRTFSKSLGLAGLRFGYIIARSNIIDQLIKLRLPWGVSNFSVHAVTVCLHNLSYFKEQIRKLCARRDRFQRQLNAMGLKCAPSDANFLLCHVPEHRKLVSELKKQKILVKDMSSSAPKSLMVRAVRITVPSAKDYTKVLGAFKAFASHHHAK